MFLWKIIIRWVGHTVISQTKMFSQSTAGNVRNIWANIYF